MKLLMIATLLLFAAPAFAFKHITVTNVETLSTSPLRVRTTFTTQDVGYHPCCAGAAFNVTSSGTGSTVHFYGATANPDFTSNVTIDWVNFNILNMNAYVGVHTFSITTDQAVPCVTLTFWDPLLGKTPHTENDEVIQGCLAADMPTPAESTSWGLIKSIYR